MARVREKAAAAPEAKAIDPAAERPAAAVEFWEGGEVRAQNIGPIRGERLLGRIDGPGLYRFVAPNANGKSRLLDLLQKIQRDKLLRSEANITHGEFSAFLEIGASRVTFRKSGAAGTVEPRREGIEQLPKIEAIPSPISTLITGANLKGEEPRAKARLEALLTYVPVEADEQRIGRLADSMEVLARVLKGAPDALRLASDWLAERAASGKVRGIGGVSFETEPQLRAWLLARQNEGILEAQQSLLDRLNALGNAAEHALAAGNDRMLAARGRADELAPKRGGVALTAQEIAALPLVGDAEIAQRAAENAAAEARVSYRHRVDEGARREQIRGTVGEAIDLAPLEAALAVADAKEGEAIAAAETALAARDAIDNADAIRSLEESRRWAAREATTVLDLAYELRVSGLGDAAEGKTFNADATLGSLRRFRTLVAGALDVAEKRLEAFATAQAEADSIGERRENAQTELDEAIAAQDLAEDRKREALERLQAGRELNDRRARILKSLAAPLTGATAEEVEAAEARAQAARETFALAGVVARYRAALADQQAAERSVGSVDDLAKAYRAAAADTWQALGGIVTEAIAVPFLQVQGLRIFLGYVAQPGRVEGRLAGENEAPGAIEWRNLDDSEMISTAELNQAILRLMLSRRSELGGILILPWEVVAALDDDRARVFSAEAKAAGLVVISERPRRDSDPQDAGIYLEKVEAGK